MASFCKFLSSKNAKLGCHSKSAPAPTLRATGNSFIVVKNNHVPPPPKQIINSCAKKKVPSLNVLECTIFDVDDIIKKNMSIDIENIKGYEEELLVVKQILINAPLVSPERALAQQKIAELRRKIKDIEGTFDYALYIFRTEDILSKYKILLKTQNKKTFVTHQNKKIDPNVIACENLVHLYYSIAQNYIQLTEIPQQSRKMVCDECYESNFSVSVDDDSIYICRVCKTQKEIFNDTPSFKDTNRVNMSSKYTYTRKGHFIDALKNFQGTQNVDMRKIRIALMTIEDEMKKHNLIARQCEKNSVDKDHIYMFLAEQSLSAHYNDLNLLFHMITGESCPDLSAIIDDIMDDFDKLEEVLSEIKDEERANSLTVDYKLYKLLQRRGFPCRKNDFFILKTKVKEDEHDEKMKEAWDILGWPWIPTF